MYFITTSVQIICIIELKVEIYLETHNYMFGWFGFTYFNETANHNSMNYLCYQWYDIKYNMFNEKK